MKQIDREAIARTLKPWFVGDLDEEWPGDDSALIDTVIALIEEHRSHGVADASMLQTRCLCGVRIAREYGQSAEDDITRHVAQLDMA